MEPNRSSDRASTARPGGGAELAMGSADSLSLLQRILLTTDGMVARILEQYAGEPIVAVKLRQALVPASTDIAELRVARHETVLSRDVILRGRDSRRNLLYAESVLCPGRLGPALVDRLVTTSIAIGELFRQHRLETFREILASGEEQAGWFARYFDVDPSALLVFRTYRIFTAGEPVVLITERFPVGGALNVAA